MGDLGKILCSFASLRLFVKIGKDYFIARAGNQTATKGQSKGDQSAINLLQRAKYGRNNRNGSGMQ